MRVLISIVGISIFILIGLMMLINTPTKTPQLVSPIQIAVLPAYNQVIKFVERDNTNTNVYNQADFNCLDYANELKQNADKQGFKCAVVILGMEFSGFPTGSHAINCFQTQDKGQVFIEPQSDKEVFNILVDADYQYGYYVLKITKVTYIW